MPQAQVESLIKLLGSTTSGRGKGNIRIPEFKNRRTTGAYDYRFRTNSVIAQNTISQNGETIRVQLPAFSACVGEMFLSLDLGALDNTGVWDCYVGAKLIKTVRLRHSDVSYEYRPELVWPILLSYCRNKEDKETRKAIFGSDVKSNGARTLVIPLLQPWSVHFSSEMYGAEPVRHGRRQSLFPAYALKENCVWEIEFHPVTYFQSGTPTNQASITNVQLLWEELVASPSVYDKIKKGMSRTVIAPDYTHLDGVTNNGSEEAYQITALLSRAPTTNIWLNLQLDANAGSRDPFNKIDRVVFEELECDGRILISDRDESEEVKRYRDVLEGVPSNRGSPLIPAISFGNDSGYSVAHASSQLSNTACNSVTLRFQASAACSGVITAEHQRQYMIESGTIKSVNIY